MGLRTKRSWFVAVVLVAVLGEGSSARALGESLEVLLANLKSPVVSTRRDAAKKLGEERRHDAASALARAATKDNDSKVRENAVWALGRVKDLKQVPAMIDVLGDNFEDVRRAALVGLVSLYKEDGIGFILNRRRGMNIVNPFLDTNDKAIIDPHVEVDERIPAAFAKTVLSDKSETMRTGAVRALGVLRATKTAPDLVKAMAQDRTVRIDALKSLIRFGISENGKYAIPYFNSTDRDVSEQAVATAGSLRSKESIPELVAFYKHSPDRQKNALRALAQIPAPEAEEIFASNLRHQESDRRQYANEGLGRIGARKHTEEISKLRLTEKNQNVLLAQSLALYLFGRKEYLLSVVQKTDSMTLDTQAEGYLRDVKNLDDLYPYLSQGSMKQRTKVADALGFIGTADSIPKLEEQLKHQGDSDFSDSVNLAIERIKHRDVPGRRPRRAENTSAAQQKADQKDVSPPKKSGRPRRVEP